MERTLSLEHKLKAEIALNREFVSVDEQVLLAFVYTELRLTRLSQAFFSEHELTDAEFDLLMILWDYRERRIRQFELANILLISRVKATYIIDRMVRRGLARREQDTNDRRANFVFITPAGERLLAKVKDPYYRLMPSLFAGLDQSRKKLFLELLDHFRNNINELAKQVRDEN